MSHERGQRTGLSRRALARVRGVSEITVRRGIARGDIKLLPDGTIDRAEADRAKAGAGIPHQELPNPSPNAALAAARTRRLRAHVLTLQDKLEALRCKLVAAEEVHRVDVAIFEAVARILLPLPDRLAPLVVGQRPVDASRIMDDAISAALTEAGAMDLGEAGAVRLLDPCLPAKSIEAMNEIELATYRADVLATMITWRRMKTRGDLLDLDDVTWDRKDRMLRARSILLYAHGKLAPRCSTRSVTKVEAMLAAEVTAALDLIRPAGSSSTTVAEAECRALAGPPWRQNRRGVGKGPA